jgi:Cys-tRNA(Pro)/Cys-tRNA(Cys) deacylase
MELDLKKLALVSGNKKVDMIAVKELLPLTGYIRGGCSPVGMKKPFPTYFEESAILYDWISVSAGMRGAQILMEPQALIDFVGAKTGDITRM